MFPIYLDHNATTPLDPRVLEAMLPHFRDESATPPAPTRRAVRLGAIENARETVARLFDAEPDEVIFTQRRHRGQ